MENCCKNNPVSLQPHSDTGRFSQGPSHSSTGLAASQEEPAHQQPVGCHVLRQDPKNLGSIREAQKPLYEAADGDAEKKK